MKGEKRQRVKVSTVATTRAEDETPKFSHDALPDPGNYIRLLTILDFDEKRPIPIRCELTTWPISGAPKYHAISYTWGDENHTATILVNDSPMQVRRNCEYVLKQATWYGGDFRRRYYWIDSICINQKSNEEKGPQVALMGEVFTNAERVLACVGKWDSTSKYMYRKVRRDVCLFEKWSSLQVGQYHALPLKSKLSWSKPVLMKLCQAQYAFFNRPYFKRVWVYQELFLAKQQVSVCCGKGHSSIRALRGLSIATSYIALPSDSLLMDFNREGGFARFNYTIRSSFLGACMLNPKPMTLAEASEYVSNLMCADPRDRVYGILSVLHRGTKALIRPDYTKDRLDVAIEALAVMSNELKPGQRWELRDIRLIYSNLELKLHTSPRLRDTIDRRRSAYQTQLDHIDHARVETIVVYSGVSVPRNLLEFNVEERHGPIIGRPELSKYFKGNYLPSVTRPGDWYLSGTQGPALIARPRADGHFDIVAKALKNTIGAPSPGLDFEVHLDAEDALVLLSTCEQDPDYRSEQVTNSYIAHYIAHYHDVRVCGHPGSSYADMLPSTQCLTEEYSM